MWLANSATRNRAFVARYGEWAVITGASSGIGREIARQSAAMGLNVVLVARSGIELTELADEIESAHRAKTMVLRADLATPAGVALVIDATKERNVGMLVNSAGFGYGGSFLETDVRQSLEMVDVNCRALLELTHAFASRFVAQRRGGIILLSSIVAFQGAPFAANYAATKGYVQSLSEGLAEELAAYGVDVLASAPGPTSSGFAERAGMRYTSAESSEKVAKETIAALGRQRLVTPGLLATILYAVQSVTPRFLRVKIMKEVMRSMT